MEKSPSSKLNRDRYVDSFRTVPSTQANESNWSEMVLEVVSTITNWHGEQDEATAMLTAAWPFCKLVSFEASTVSLGFSYFCSYKTKENVKHIIFLGVL